MSTPAPEFDSVPPQERRRVHRAIGIYIHQCWNCRHSFLATRSDARYCSNRCRQAAYRARHR